MRWKGLWGKTQIIARNDDILTFRAFFEFKLDYIKNCLKKAINVIVSIRQWRFSVVLLSEKEKFLAGLY
ncbi:hypothetical protein CF160_06765 [Enterococcus pseudoavium]|nr:hypothetical protein CF160_06765 [Enterococcus pseudoavium]